MMVQLWPNGSLEVGRPKSRVRLAPSRVRKNRRVLLATSTTICEALVAAGAGAAVVVALLLLLPSHVVLPLGDHLSEGSEAMPFDVLFAKDIGRLRRTRISARATSPQASHELIGAVRFFGNEASASEQFVPPLAASFLLAVVIVVFVVLDLVVVAVVVSGVPNEPVVCSRSSDSRETVR